MINPDEQLPPDDAQQSDVDDQQSQQDIHSNGLEPSIAPENSTHADILQQAYDAAQSAYTLNLDDDEPAAG